MKKGVIILVVGLVLATAAFSGFYYAGTASCRSMMREPEPELAWLKREFHLSDAEFTRISDLHAAYLPRCRQRCQRVEEQNAKLQQLLPTATDVTPEIRALLAERAKMRADCEAEMLQHFLEVSRSMPPQEGRRYLEWVERQTYLQGQGMEQQHRTADHDHMSHESHK
jgi:hypothetical protein